MATSTTGSRIGAESGRRGGARPQPGRARAVDGRAAPGVGRGRGLALHIWQIGKGALLMPLLMPLLIAILLGLAAAVVTLYPLLGLRRTSDVSPAALSGLAESERLAKDA